MKKYIIVALILIIIVCFYIGVFGLNNKNIPNVNMYTNDTNCMIVYDSSGNPLKDLSSMFNITKK